MTPQSRRSPLTQPSITPDTPAAALPARMTAQQVAGYLGMHLKTVYAEQRAGRLPAVPHAGRSWRWTRETILAYSTPQTKGTPNALRETVRAELRDALRGLLEQLERELPEPCAGTTGGIQRETASSPGMEPRPRRIGWGPRSDTNSPGF